MPSLPAVMIAMLSVSRPELSSTTTTATLTPTTEDRLRALEREKDELRRELALLKGEQESLRIDQEALGFTVDGLLPLKGRLTGYIDVGFFYVQGDGTGIRADIGHVAFPEYDEQVADSWVFAGDPLSTAINSRGDPASTGDSRAVTFDPIKNQSKPTFLVNAVSVALFGGIGTDLTVNAVFDLVPRGRDVSSSTGLFLGDFLEVKLAYAEYLVPIEAFSLSLSAGKFDSVLGVEYRSQEAPDRISVTPSLICRYTCGRPLGVKARAKFLDDALVINLAATNGSYVIESFPFHDEADSNLAKTGALRISYQFPIGAGLEVGASGSIGAQDGQRDNTVLHWHYGFDVRLIIGDLEAAAEYVQGRAVGSTEDGGPVCGLAPCLEYMGAYGLIGYRATNWLMPYTRVDWREALHRSGASFVYVSNSLRFTGGVRIELGTHVVVKAEYTLNRELGRVPNFANDIFTSALVVKF